MGFRPFIYRIAREANVRGYVKNLGGAEVEIYIEGSREEIERFFKLFWTRRPQVIIVDKIRVERAQPRGYTQFIIEKSSREPHARSVIPPDFAICEECLREVLDANDSRRFRYAFNSCVFCGPRFSMMYDNPWDRENTAMRDFPLCEYCLREYTDPENVRRFHAQGISCKLCGPRLTLLTRDGEKVDVDDPIREAAKLINEGYIIAVKGVGGFHIACLATDDDVVLRLRHRKRRPQQPFAIMVLDEHIASKLVYLDDKALQLLKSVQRPILLLRKREDAPVSKYVAPGLEHLGVFLPYTALHYLLLQDVKDKFAIMTSGNVHGKPMCIKNEQALRELKDIVDYFLVHNREIVNRVDDSVIRFTDGELILLRRGRGYAPYWLDVPIKLPEGKVIVALGALLQNCGAIMFDDKVVMTQYIGDCDDFDTLQELEHYIHVLARMYRLNLKNAVFVCDLHPEYATTQLCERLAQEYGGEVIKVQHHWAHIVSAMADRKVDIDDTVIGVAIDGVGYGLDGQVWGGEILLCTYTDFTRAGHLRYVTMPGGDLATYYPLRMTIAFLLEFLDENEVRRVLISRNLVERGLKYGEQELEIVFLQVRQRKILTSSMGRLLDAVAALLDICLVRTYEGEPAIKLEAEAFRSSKDPELIDIPVRLEDDRCVIDTVRIFEWLLENIDRYDRPHIAKSVLYSIGYALGRACLAVRRRKIERVVLSGGAAVNEFIVKGLKDAVRGNLTVLLPRRVPANDGGIALGQAAIVAAKIAMGQT